MKYFGTTNPYFWLPIVLVATLAACRKDDKPAYSNMELVFQNVDAGQPITLGGGQHTNINGNVFTFDMLKYYISNVELVDAEGHTVAMHNHDLVDLGWPGSEVLHFDSVPNGRYTILRFQLGVDSLYNHDGDQAGDLDPVHGMLWSWNTGYIFFKHEGQYINALGQWDQMLYHYGTDGGIVNLELPLQSFALEGADRKVYLDLDFRKLYGSPNVLDFYTDNTRQSVSFTDRDWLARLQQNFYQAFSVNRVE